MSLFEGWTKTDCLLLLNAGLIFIMGMAIADYLKQIAGMMDRFVNGPPESR